MTIRGRPPMSPSYAKTSTERLSVAARQLRIELDLHLAPGRADAVATVGEPVGEAVFAMAVRTVARHLVALAADHRRRGRHHRDQRCHQRDSRPRKQPCHQRCGGQRYRWGWLRQFIVVSGSSLERISFYLELRINHTLIIVESFVNSHVRSYYLRNTSRCVIEIPRNKKYPR